MSDEATKEMLNILKHYLIAVACREKGGNGPASMLMRTIDISTEENPYPSCDFYVLVRQPDGTVTKEPRWYTREAKRARFWWRKVPSFVATCGFVTILVNGFSWFLPGVALVSIAILLFSFQTVRAALGVKF